MPNNRSVYCLPLSVRAVRILNGAALRTAAKKALADAAVLYCLMAINTQRVALSIPTNT